MKKTRLLLQKLAGIHRGAHDTLLEKPDLFIPFLSGLAVGPVKYPV